MQSPLVKERMTDKINHVLLPACKEGNQDATHWMFVAYVNGLGVEQDEDKSLEYLKILAECGCPDMQCELGKWYETVDCGTCKEEMNRESVKWFAKAVERGHEEAKAELEFYNRRESEKAFEEDGFFALFDVWGSK